LAVDSWPVWVPAERSGEPGTEVVGLRIKTTERGDRGSPRPSRPWPATGPRSTPPDLLAQPVALSPPPPETPLAPGSSGLCRGPSSTQGVNRRPCGKVAVGCGPKGPLGARRSEVRMLTDWLQSNGWSGLISACPAIAGRGRARGHGAGPTQRTGRWAAAACGCCGACGWTRVYSLIQFRLIILFRARGRLRPTGFQMRNALLVLSIERQFQKTVSRLSV